MTDANLVRVLQAQTPAQGRACIDASAWSIARRRRRGDRARASAQLRGEGVAHRDRRRDRQRRPAAPRRRAAATCRWSRAGSGVAIGLPANFGIAPSAAAATLPAVQRLARGRLGQLLDGDQRAGRATSCAAAARRCASIRSRSPRGDDARRARRWPGPSAHAARERPVLVYATADAATRCRRCRRGSASSDAGALVERALARDRARRWSSAACASSSSPAARPRARACRRSASRSCASAPQIDPGVPWCHAAPARAADGPAHRAEVGQLRRAPTSSAKALRGALRMTRTKPRCATRSAASAAACSSAATCTARPATSACGSHDGFLITPTDACLGFLDPAALAQGRRARPARCAARAPSKTLALHRAHLRGATADARAASSTRTARTASRSRLAVRARTATTACRRSRRTS